MLGSTNCLNANCQTKYIIYAIKENLLKLFCPFSRTNTFNVHALPILSCM